MYSKFKTVITLVDTLTWAVKKCIFNHTHTIKINWLTANLEGGINMGILAGLEFSGQNGAWLLCGIRCLRSTS